LINVTEKTSLVETEKLNILVVDDDPVIRDYIGDALGTIFFRILHARDGVEALRLIDSSPELIDVLLLDVVMPRLNGNELARVIKSWHPNIKIIFMSGYPDDLNVNQGIPSGDISFLGKPFTVKCLLQAVKESLQDRMANNVEPI
jgi:two-component system, cell cycle sensor histidine kinase and response regulator CckA